MTRANRPGRCSTEQRPEPDYRSAAANPIAAAAAAAVIESEHRAPFISMTFNTLIFIDTSTNVNMTNGML